MSGDFDSEIVPIHHVDHLTQSVEQSFMIGVFIICVILVVITLWYVNFSPTIN